MKTVVVILGFRRSGSTILAKGIGSHNQCFAIGEINYFYTEVSNTESPCGCGEKYYSCKFWNKVITEINKEKNTDVRLSEKDFNVKIDNEITKIKNLPYLFQTLLFKSIYKGKFLKRKIEDTFYLYDKIFKVSNTNFLIDSSKSIFRALVLASFGKIHNVNFKFIYLVRDGRAVLNSTQKSSYAMKQKDGSSETTNVETKKPEIEINRWRFTNLLYLFIFKCFRSKSFIKVKHEEFCNNPEATLSDICKYLQIDYQPDMINIGQHEQHILGGNPSRVNAKAILKQEETWRTKLSADQLKKFNRKAGWLNNLLGY